MTAPTRPARSGVLTLLPLGLPLSDAHWNQRHRLILVVLGLHLPILGALAVFGGHFGMMAMVEIVGLILLPGLVAAASRNRTLASFSAALALLGTSATMVELLGGATTAHFGFFVSLGFIALYQSWPVYLLAVAFTAVHHLAMAVWMPMHLFSAGSAESHAPVVWALVHAVFILAGAAAISAAAWTFYLLGGFLLYTALALAFESEDPEGEEPDEHRAVAALRRVLPLTEDYHDARFVVRIDGRRFATPLVLAITAIAVANVVEICRTTPITPGTKKFGLRMAGL